MLNREFSSGEELVQTLRSQVPELRRFETLGKILKYSLGLPRKILDDERGVVWYLPDWRFRRPKAQIQLKIYTSPGSATPKDAMLGRMYAAAFSEAENERGYPVRLAGLGVSVEWGVSGVQVNLAGYSGRMLELLKDVFGKLQTIELDEQRFAALKEQALRSLQSGRFSEPYQQARYYGRLLLNAPSHSREALQKALAPITLQDVREFAAGIYRRTYLEGVVVGNLSPSRAREAILAAYGGLNGSPLPEGERVRPTVYRVPAGRWDFTKKLPVGNSFAGMYFDAGPRDPRKRGALLLVNRPLRASFYFNMRTRQQLGYIVFGGMSEREKILNLVMVVQSGVYSAGELLERMDEFVPKFLEDFRQIPDSEFETFRKAVIDAKLEKTKDLASVASRLFWTAFKHEERWDHVSTDIAAVEQLTKAETEKILRDILNRNKSRRISIRLFGKDHPTSPPVGTPIEPGDPRFKKAS